jgi:nitrate/nitrite-specific signal transduction histidine kinase
MIKTEQQSLAIDFLDRLGTKITFAAVVFVFALVTAMVFLVNAGIRNTQLGAYHASQEVIFSQAEAHVSKRAQELAAVLEATLNASPTGVQLGIVSRQLEEIQFESETQALVVDQLGALQAPRTSENQLLVDALHGEGLLFGAGQSGAFRSEWSGEKVVVAYTPILDRGWSLVLVSPLASIEAQTEGLANVIWMEAEDSIRQTLLLVLAVSVVGLIGLPILLNRLVSRRVSALTSGVKAIAEGNLDIRIPTGPRDELGLLAESFNQMAAELKQRAEFLEQRVAERTQEITQLHAQSEKRSRELEVLYLADEQLYRHLRLDQVLQALVDVTVDLLGADKSSVQVWDENRQRLGVRAWRNLSPAMLQQLQDYKAGDGIAGKVFQTGKPMAVEDAGSAPPPADVISKREGIASVLSVPISIAGKVFGVFGMNYSQPHSFSADDIRLFSALAQRAAIAIENARLYEQAERAATLEERQRLARELHDAITQSLYSLVLLSEAGRRYASMGNLEQVEHHLNRLGESAQQALKEMRLLVYDLRPLALQDIGLEGALRQRLDAVEKRAGIQARLVVNEPLDLPGKVEEELYRIAQEALNNALRHAHATVTAVEILRAVGSLELEVRDNGVGFDPTLLQGGGIGMQSMRERVLNLGGELEIDSKPGKGAIVRIKLPLSPDSGIGSEGMEIET